MAWFLFAVAAGLAGWFYWQSRSNGREAEILTKRNAELSKELETERANHVADVGRMEAVLAERTQELFDRDVELRAALGVRPQTIGETSPGGATVTMSEPGAPSAPENVDV